MLSSMVAGVALTTALAATPAAADVHRSSTSSATAASPVATMDGCASLVSNAAGRATVKNICSYKVWATVSVDWSWDPTCIDINPGKTRALTWDPGKGKAEYAYEC